MRDRGNAGAERTELFCRAHAGYRGPGARVNLRARPARSGVPKRSALVEHQDRAGDFARLHRAKRLVDVLQAAAPRDHLVEHEAPLAVVVDVAGHVHLEAVRAHAAALYLLLAQEHLAVELDLLAHRDHADDGRGAAGADAV